MEQPGPAASMSWVLDDLVRRVEGITQAVLLSRDGLVLGASHGLTKQDAEQLSAMAAGVQSLACAVGEQFGGGTLRQTIIEMEKALLFIVAAGEGSCLAVLCPLDSDPGLIAYEMAMLVKRIGRHLAAGHRPVAVHTERSA
jgi:predicted regulator of Ras-like GTPase activity (Roadblock/LC7/MglB family)